MANLTQAIAQRPPATMHVSQPVVNVTNKVMAKGDVSKLPAPQVHLEPFSKIQASTVSCGKNSIQPPNPGSSANMSLSSAIALESAQKSLAAAKTTGPRLVMHTQEQAQAAVKAMLDKKALTKTNSPVLVATRQPPSSVPDLSTEVLHKVMSASSAQNKTNSPRTESQAVVTTGTGKQVSQPQTILGTVQSVNAATRAALTPNSGSHSPNATPHTPPSPPQNLALQPMTPPSAPAPQAPNRGVPTKEQIYRSLEKGLAGGRITDVILAGAIQSTILSKEEVLEWTLQKMISVKTIENLVTRAVITEEDKRLWEARRAAQLVQLSKSNTPVVANSASSSAANTSKTSAGAVASSATTQKPLLKNDEKPATLDDVYTYNSKTNTYLCVQGKGQGLSEMLTAKLKNPSLYPDMHCDKNTTVQEISYQGWDKLWKIWKQQM